MSEVQGTTYLAHDEGGRRAAIKELSVRKIESLKTIEIFEREARTLEALEHPRIPRYVDDFVIEFERDVRLYLVQEFIDGEPLPRDARLSQDEVMGIAGELAEVLEYLHSRRPPVVHRDIKPSNIILRTEGSVALVDFGAVKGIVRAEAGGSTVAGTFGYMAPEQYRGKANPRSDLYSIGALCVALLSGRDAADVIDITRPDEWRREVEASAPFLDVISRLLAPRPERRPSSAAELARLITEARTRCASVQAVRPKSKVDSVPGKLARSARPRLRRSSEKKRGVKVDSGDEEPLTLGLATVIAGLVFWGSVFILLPISLAIFGDERGGPIGGASALVVALLVAGTLYVRDRVRRAGKRRQ